MELGSQFQVTLGNQNMTMNKEALWKGRKNRTEGPEGQRASLQPPSGHSLDSAFLIGKMRALDSFKVFLLKIEHV